MKAAAKPDVADKPGAAAASALRGSPVLGIAPERSIAAPLVCGRCRGSNEPGMSFCRYCGSPFGGPEKTEAPPRPAPERPRAPSPGQPQAPNQPQASEPPQAPQPKPASHQQALHETRFQYGEQPVSARLIVIGQDGRPGKSYAISSSQTDIGREEGSVQLPNDPFVSPRHARITYRNGSYWVRDLDSLNGVFTRLRNKTELRHSDFVLIGLEVLRFEVVNSGEQGLGQATELGTHVFGSPAVPRFARLCQRTVEGVTRDVFYISRNETIIGREAGDIVFTSDPFMSRRHAAIVRDQNHCFTIEDLGSSNGTYLAIRGECELKEGDHVRIGQHLFRLDIEPGGRG